MSVENLAIVLTSFCLFAQITSSLLKFLSPAAPTDIVPMIMPLISISFVRTSRSLRSLARYFSRISTSIYLPLPSTKSSSQHRPIRVLPCLGLVFLLLFLLFIYSYLHQTHPPPPFPLLSGFEEISVASHHASISSDRPFRLIIVLPPFTHALKPQNPSIKVDYSPGDTSLDVLSHTPEAFGLLISSLVSAQYDNDTVNLDIILSPEPNRTSFHMRYSLCETLIWPHGTKFVRNATTGGLFELGVSSWNPTKGDPENILIIDASRATLFSSQFYRYLKSVRRRYQSIVADVAGFAIHPVLVRRPASIFGKPTGHYVSQEVGEGSAGNDVFLYQSLPFVPAFSPLDSDTWRAFQRWFAMHRGEWFLWPTVVGAKDKADAAWAEYRGTARAHWSLWFSRFCAEYGIYVMYPRKGRLEPLPAAESANAVLPLSRFDFAGRDVEQKQEIGQENLERVIELGRRQGGSVSLTIVNSAFVETARSWICNVDVAGIRPPGILWITTDEEAYEALKDVKDSQIVRMTEFKGGSASKGTSYGTPGYWLLMLERTKLIRAILDRGVGVFLFETDQVWLRDPIPFVKRLVHSGDEVDVVGTMDTRHEIGGNFLYLNPTLSTRRLWGEVCRRFAKAYKDNKMDSHTSRYKRYMENDQSTLTKLIFFDEKFKSMNPVVFRALDVDLFVDGRWYDDEGKKYTSARSRSPIVINNNFLVGINNKKKRAQQHGHWFLQADERTCDVQLVRRAVRDNELRASIQIGQSGDWTEDDERRRAAVESAERAKDGDEAALLDVHAARVEGADVEAGFDAAMKAIGKELAGT